MQSDQRPENRLQWTSTFTHASTANAIPEQQHRQPLFPDSATSSIVQQPMQPYRQHSAGAANEPCRAYYPYQQSPAQDIPQAVATAAVMTFYPSPSYSSVSEHAQYAIDYTYGTDRHLRNTLDHRQTPIGYSCNDSCNYPPASSQPHCSETAHPTPVRIMGCQHQGVDDDTPSSNSKSRVSRNAKKLQRRKNNSNDTATYQCSHPGCGRSFTRAYNLTSHMRTHTSERPFACSQCGRRFARQHDRNRHEKLHWNIKPYVCPNCRKPFARMDALNRHLKVENGCGSILAAANSQSL